MSDVMLKNKMYSLVNNLQNIQDEKEAMDEVVANIVKEYGVKKSFVTKTAKIMFKNKLAEAQQELNNLDEFITKVNQ